MTLRTVRVPPDVEPLFDKAEQVVSRFFRERKDDPTVGTIEIFGERYVLLRAASLSVEFFDLVRGFYGAGREAEADDFARNILYDLAHTVGRSDARNFHVKMGLDDPIARLSAGPVHFAHAGWAFVDISPNSNPVQGDDYVLHYDHPYSFESDTWLRSGRRSTYPVCIMNAGYSSGWCSESFGQPLVSAEVRCRGRGDDACRFVMAPPHRIEEYVARFRGAPNDTFAARASAPIPDFFARKRIEEDLRRRFAEELREREAAEERLRRAQKLEAVGRLAGGVAHDFNNLMTVVIARANRIARKMPEGDPVRRELEGIVEAGERASALTGQLLAFSRAQVVQREPVEVDRVLTDLARVFRAPDNRPITLDLTLDATGMVVLVDRSQLEQLALNLIVNARDAMPSGGVIRIASEVVRNAERVGDVPVGECIKITVTDEGVGMDDATLARIFEPYFTTKPGHGTGLGLATAYGIVQQAGGGILVSSRVGHGTEFQVFLPVHSRGGAGGEIAEVLAERTIERRLRLVLVEDHPDVRATLEIGLTDAGHDVVAYADPRAAMSVDDTTLGAMDALVTDVAMPEHSGIEVAQALRERRPNLPVVFVTGYAADPTALAAVRGSRVLAKPFRTEELVHTLWSLLRATGDPKARTPT